MISFVNGRDYNEYKKSITTAQTRIKGVFHTDKLTDASLKSHYGDIIAGFVKYFEEINFRLGDLERHLMEKIYELQLEKAA